MVSEIVKIEDDKGVGSEHNLLVVHVDEANRLVYQLVTLRDVPIPDVKVDHHDEKNIKDQKGNITVKYKSSHTG